ncbi:MAG: DNA repair protein RecN [Desulfatirhabdiaceae bacterium]
MLQELSIKNFAIIDDLHIDFSEGLTVLTGETGAGKSIIIQAVNLILGSRADTTMIRTGSDTAELEAFFDVRPKSATSAIMETFGFEASEGLLIRRILSASERHRIYINGRISTLQILSGITEHLASISGQHAHQLLLREDRHLIFLDAFGGLLDLRNQVYQAYHQLIPLLKRRNELKTLQARQSNQIDLLTHQQTEILLAAIQPEEDMLLEQERLRLKNRETINQAIHHGIETLYNSENAIFDRLSSLQKMFDRIQSLDIAFQPIHQKMSDAIFLIEDIYTDLRTRQGDMPMDDRRLEEVESRLDMLNRLKRKYGGSIPAVFEQLDAISRQLSQIENLDADILSLQAEIESLRTHLIALASRLSAARQDAARLMAEKIVHELSELKMGHSRFQIQLTPLPADRGTDLELQWENRTIRDSGWDKALFMISANAGESLKPLAAIASGGELSRVILGLKAILAETESVETVIFDEVDAGIGGGVADVVGKKLCDLSRQYQVICITHLPQIARFGHIHFSISKQIRDGRTLTTIEPLTESGRVMEIARMLGGENLTPTTIDHAREMLQNRP